MPINPTLSFQSDSEIELQVSQAFRNLVDVVMHTHKISRLDLCDRLNIKYSSLSRILAGPQRVGLSHLLKLCTEFNISLDSVINEISIIKLK